MHDPWQARKAISLLRSAVALAQLSAPDHPEVQAALDDLHIARGCADLVSAAENALDLLTTLYPTLSPNETTHDMAIWVACEKLRTALAATSEHTADDDEEAIDER